MYLLPLLSLLTVGCGGNAEEPEAWSGATENKGEADAASTDAPKTDAPAATTDNTPPVLPWNVKTHMHEHFDYATDALYFTFQADIPRLNAESKKLAEHTVPADMPDNWKPHAEKLVKQAQGLSEVSDLDAAAGQVAAMGRTCAQCHTEVGGPKPKIGDVLDGADLFTDKAMDRHQWAMYLFWLGVVVPSDELWDAGAKTMAQKEGKMPEIDPKAEPFHQRVHELSDKAAAAKTDDERAAVLAGFIASCNGCHDAMDVEFKH